MQNKFASYTKRFIFLMALFLGAIALPAFALPPVNNINGPATSPTSAIQYISCDSSVPGLNPGLNCGYVSTYFPLFSAADTCSISGAGQENGLNILGGQVCSIGGTDQPGYYNNGGNQTVLSDYAGGPPPGWSYNKTVGLTQIPKGMLSPSPDAPLYNDGFFGGTVAFNLNTPADDESSLQIGSNQSGIQGCQCAVTSQSRSGCPSTQQVGPSSFAVNGGENVVFNTTNLCAPKTNYGQWGGATVNNFSLSPVTVCYTAAYMQSVGGYSYVTDYVPTGPGQCAPSSMPLGTIIVQSVDTNGNPVSSSWTITSSGVPLSDSGTSQTYSNEPAKVSYAIIPGDAPSGYDNPTIYTNGNAISSGMLTDGGTTIFTIVWEKQTVAVPVLSAGWSDGSNATSVTVVPGQTSVSVPLQFSNTGAKGTVISENGCNGSSTAFGVTVVGHCPSAQLTAP